MRRTRSRQLHSRPSPRLGATLTAYTPPAAANLGMSGTPVLTGQEGVVYTSWTVTASNGTAPYTYSSTSLPPGLSVNSSTGLVSGTPTTAGSYSGTVDAIDSAGSPLTGSLPFGPIVIAAGLAGLPAEPTRGYLTAS